jgi:hypothetical protein
MLRRLAFCIGERGRKKQGLTAALVIVSIGTARQRKERIPSRKLIYA